MFSLLLYVVLEGAIKKIQGFEATFFFLFVCLFVLGWFSSLLLLYVCVLRSAIKELAGIKANMFIFVDIESGKPIMKSILHK